MSLPRVQCYCGYVWDTSVNKTKPISYKEFTLQQEGTGHKQYIHQ